MNDALSVPLETGASLFVWVLYDLGVQHSLTFDRNSTKQISWIYVCILNLKMYKHLGRPAAWLAMMRKGEASWSGMDIRDGPGQVDMEAFHGYGHGIHGMAWRGGLTLREGETK